MRPPADTAITPRVLSQHALERVAQRQREYRASKHSRGKLQRSQAESDAVAALHRQRAWLSARGRETRRTRSARRKRYHRRCCSHSECAVAVAADEAEALSVAAGLARRAAASDPREALRRGGTASGRGAPSSGLQRQSERDINGARAGARGRNNIGAASRALALARATATATATATSTQLALRHGPKPTRSTRRRARDVRTVRDARVRVARHVPAGCAARDVRVALRSGGPDARRPCR